MLLPLSWCPKGINRGGGINGISDDMLSSVLLKSEHLLGSDTDKSDRVSQSCGEVYNAGDNISEFTAALFTAHEPIESVSLFIAGGE